MTADLAFLVKGQTFFKVIAPLVVFARRNLSMRCHLIVYRDRPGKSYDNASPDIVEKIRMLSLPDRRVPFIPLDITWVSGEADAQETLRRKGIENVVCQDAQHHFSFLKDEFRVFSISVYTDTLHYAAHQYEKEAWLPYKTYFPSELLKQKTQELSGTEWNSAVLGSPMLDHHMWASKNNKQDSLLFLTPPAGILHKDTLNELADLACYCKSVGYRFRYKDRPRFPWQRATADMEYIDMGETALPYASMSLMCKSSMLVCAFSISAFEAQFLGLPVLNLDVQSSNSSIGNIRVSEYGLESVYDSGNAITRRTGLVDAFDELAKLKGFPKRQITWSSNYSTDILRDILEELR